jgi:broad specificity polyphosphatase/5'/3'-nucleotidase SurE
MKYPLRDTKYFKNGNFFGYAVEGTPADCVKMGIRWNIMFIIKKEGNSSTELSKTS